MHERFYLTLGKKCGVNLLAVESEYVYLSILPG
jgi:hypothetical protein